MAKKSYDNVSGILISFKNFENAIRNGTVCNTADYVQQIPETYDCFQLR